MMRYASIIYRDYIENALFAPGAGEKRRRFYSRHSVSCIGR